MMACEGRVGTLNGSGVFASGSREEVGSRVRFVSLSRKSAAVNHFGTVFELTVAMVSWNGLSNGGHRVASGIYFLVLHAGEGEKLTERIVLVR
jgi:hypothetical protein